MTAHELVLELTLTIAKRQKRAEEDVEYAANAREKLHDLLRSLRWNLARHVFRRQLLEAFERDGALLLGVAHGQVARATRRGHVVKVGLLRHRRKVRRHLGQKRAPLVGRFAVYYLWDLILANLRVAYDVITPPYYMRPGVIAIPLDAKTDVEISMLANLITLTPGTLSLDISPDHRVLYIHAMYIDRDDVEGLRRHIKETLERRILEILR